MKAGENALSPRADSTTNPPAVDIVNKVKVERRSNEISTCCARLGNELFAPAKPHGAEQPIGLVTIQACTGLHVCGDLFATFAPQKAYLQAAPGDANAAEGRPPIALRLQEVSQRPAEREAQHIVAGRSKSTFIW